MSRLKENNGFQVSAFKQIEYHISMDSRLDEVKIDLESCFVTPVALTKGREDFNITCYFAAPKVREKDKVSRESKRDNLKDK